jgi:hypothetical protein
MATDRQQDLNEAIRSLPRGRRRGRGGLAGRQLGAGGGDVFSDCDILALTRRRARGEAAKRYAADLSAIAPTVLVNTLYGRVVSAVTDDWRRFDLSFRSPPSSPLRPRRARARCSTVSGHEPPAGNTPPHRIDPAPLSRHQLRGVLPGAGPQRRRPRPARKHRLPLREELLRRMLVDVCWTRTAWRAERGGALKRNPLADPRTAAELLGPARRRRADREGVLAGNAGPSRGLPAARPRLAAKCARPWPDALEARPRAHLLRHLGQSLPE